MEINLILKGFGAGLVVAIPIGPVGLLCTQRILAGGRMHGLVSGLGAATADVIYSSIVAFGLTIVSDFLVENQVWFRLFAGIFLCLLGARAFLTKHAKRGALADKLCHFNNYSSTLLLTLANPMAILVLAGLFAGFGVVGSGSARGDAVPLVAGVFLGSMFWWVLLSISVGVFHKKVSDNTLIFIARIFGAILTTLGIVVIISTLVSRA
ncbi:MAG: LysE family transporter [Planctomycetota bacterium]